MKPREQLHAALGRLYDAIVAAAVPGYPPENDGAPRRPQRHCGALGGEESDCA